MRSALCLTLFAALAHAAAPEWSEIAVRNILVQRIDLDKKSTGIVAGLISTDKKLVVAYGRAAKDREIPLDGGTLFEIGSISKAFTATLLADMLRRGEVKLDDPISKYLPKDVKAPARNGKEITLGDLATQSSGLPRLPTNFRPANIMNPYADYDAQKLYAFLGSYTLDRDIGERYEYSNLGFGLLGHLLERRAGKDYESLLVSRIADPLHMDSTRIRLPAELQRRMAQGHNGALAPVPNWDLAVLAGAGGIRSSVDDMLKFAAANAGLADSPLAGAMREAQRVRRPAGSPEVSIGLGWHTYDKFGRHIVWHNGGTGGFRSFLGFDPAAKTAVVVLSNTSNDIDDIGRHLLESQYPLSKFEPPKQRSAIQLDPKILDNYTGKYSLGPGFDLAITREGDRMFGQATGQPKVEIFAEAEGEFFLKVVDAQISFVKGEGGKAASLVLHQNGQNISAKRVE